MVTSVIKRDGSIEEFNFDCIVDAAKRAYNSYGKEVPTKLFNHIKKHIEEIEDGKTPTVEDILDIMEESLGEIGEIKILRSFIQYRFRRKLKRETKRGSYKGTTLVDCAKTIWEYVKGTDWRVKANANAGYSHAGLIKNTAGKIIANFWLDQVFSQEEGAAHRNGDLYIHDLDSLSIYCVGHSLRQLLNLGFGTGKLGRPQSKAPRHLASAIDQMVNYLSCLQHEAAGAQAFSSVDTYLAPFVFIDDLNQQQVTDIMESFIFNMNQNNRQGESVFSNVSWDVVVSDDLKNDVPMCDNEPLFARYQEVLDKGDVENPLFETATNLAVKAVKRGKSNLLELTYGDFQDEAEMIVIGFYKILTRGDKFGGVFTFPIGTVNILPTFKWDSPVADAIFENAAKVGSSYFQNFLGSQYRINPETGEKEVNPDAFKPGDVRSMCVLPDTMVHIKEVKTRKLKHLTFEELFNNYKIDEYLILTRYGYKPVKQEFKLKYSGDMVKVTTESGATLTTTLDHPWRVYDGKSKHIIEKLASEITVEDRVSLRSESNFTKLNKERLGKTFEKIYGEEDGARLRKLRSEISKKVSIFNTDKNPALNMSQAQKDAISKGCKGHYVSDNCRQKSSERWSGKNNPVFNQEYWERNRLTSAVTSKHELAFANELEALGLEYVHQFVVDKEHIVDFYIPSKNLVVELETKYKGCSYNEENHWAKHHGKTGTERLSDLRERGYNVLIFNPRENSDEYRKYLNKAEAITNIETIPYDGFVYDVEVETTDNSKAAHSFYANEILTGNCCRLQLNLKELRKKGGGLFGSGEMTGSIGVVTLNMARLGYVYSGDKHGLYKRLDELLDMVKSILTKRRKFCEEMRDRGLYPYTSFYIPSWQTFFSTCGLVGCNELLINFFKDKSITTGTKQGIEFCKEILNHIREKLVQFQDETGALWNLEATPAEGATFRLAKADRLAYPDIITAGSGENIYYTNSSQLPVNFTDDPFLAFDLQDELQTLYTGGTVLHYYHTSESVDKEACKKIVKRLLETHRLPYMSMTPTFCVCEKHGRLPGNLTYCPHCDNEIIQKYENEQQAQQ